MSVVIYRNRLNEEMKRFGKFSRGIADNLQKEDIKAGIIFKDNKKECLKEMKNHDTIIIITHGSKSALYHRYDHKYESHQTLISVNEILNKDIEVLDALKNKKIIAISCATTQELAGVACQSGECRVYLGFKHRIHFEKLNKKKASNKYNEFLVHCYKEAFSSVLEKAIRESWKFSKLALVLKIELKQIVTSKAKQLAERKPNFYRNHGVDQAVIAITNVANNIEVFGNKSELVN